MSVCPSCGSARTVKNGLTRHGKQSHRCRECGRQFSDDPTNKQVGDQKALIDRLSLEKLSLAGIARAAQVSETWLQGYVNRTLEAVPRSVNVPAKRALVVECDELWSFVGRKSEPYWLWLAVDRQTREVVGLHLGSRDEAGAIALWESLPECCWDATAYTDFHGAYTAVLYEKRYVRVGKGEAGTQHVERFNNTLRQRVARLVRKPLAFSKKLENHLGAIWLFVHHHNAPRQS